MYRVGVVSIGKMGLTISQSVINSGNQVHWTSEGRSQQTLNNAKKIAGAVEHKSLPGLMDASDVLFCIGRLNIGVETITAAAENGFKGIYVDGNNLYGEESEKQIEEIAESAKIKYVEALFRGFPIGYDQGGGEDKRDLYLSGQWRFAKIIESLFSDGIWKAQIVPESAKALNRTKFKRLF